LRASSSNTAMNSRRSLALELRIGHRGATRGSAGGVHVHQVSRNASRKCGRTEALALSQHAVVDEDAGQLAADRPGIRTATTEESTRPTAAEHAVAPDWVRIASVAESTNDAMDHCADPTLQESSEDRLACGVCATSGWNWTAKSRRVSPPWRRPAIIGRAERCDPLGGLRTCPRGSSRRSSARPSQDTGGRGRRSGRASALPGRTPAARRHHVAAER